MACTETFLDECVKYTGANAPSLGINTNDSLLVVEESLITSLTSVLDNLSLYVQKSEFCCLLETCTSSIPVVTLASDKMLPYAVVPYYGPTTGYPTVNDTFDSEGVGTGYWARVFMCNGDNGTPDLRGRVPVGATNTPSTIEFPPQTNPGVNGNPVYTYGLTPGKNTITLELPQIPAHTHETTVTINDPGHFHNIDAQSFNIKTYDRPNGSGQQAGTSPPTSTDMTGLKGTQPPGVPGQNVFVTNDPAGQDQSHNNYQPGLALYYIQYRPV
jgi:microcystin-dependent protein